MGRLVRRHPVSSGHFLPGKNAAETISELRARIALRHPVN
jgi:hypothetical protein